MRVEKFDFIFKMLLNSCCKSIERQWKEILSYNISRIQVSTSDIVIKIFEVFVYLEQNFKKNFRQKLKVKFHLSGGFNERENRGKFL